jgi:hypothetical protein
MANRELLDRAVAERRDLTAEEDAQWTRTDNRIVRIDKQKEELLSSDTAQRTIEEINGGYRSVYGDQVVDSNRAQERALLQDFSGR